MGGELNTEVHDDPGSCRETADWLSTLQPGVSRVGDVVHQQRSASESFWQGVAGDACRGSLASQGNDADEVENQVGQVKHALLTFASAIDGVRSSMNHAREAATAAKLIVTPTTILPPEPVAESAGPLAPEQHEAFTKALKDYGSKQEAFENVKGIVDAARSRQQEAHSTLDKAMQDPLATIKTMKTWTMFVVGHGLGTVKGSFETANELFEKSDRWNAAAETIQARAEQKPGNLRTLGMNAAEAGKNTADDAAARATTASKFGGTVPTRIGQMISANPSRWVKAGGTVAKAGSKFVRGVPFLGSGLSIASGIGDVAMGKDPLEAGEDTAANIGGGAAGGWAGAAIGTAICPGVGTVIGGVVGGIAGSMAATEGVSAARGD